MNDMKGRNRAPPTAEGQAALRVGVHLKRHIDGEKQGYHLLWTSDGGRNLRRRSQKIIQKVFIPPCVCVCLSFFNMPNKCVSGSFSTVLLMATLPCDTSVTDRVPALANARAANDLDTLTLFGAAQTGGPAASPVEQRIWILHDWLRRSIPPVPPLPRTLRGPPTRRPPPRSRLCHRAGAGREVADGAPIHLPPEPGDGSIGCPLLGSEHTQEDGLVGQLTKGGKACR